MKTIKITILVFKAVIIIALGLIITFALGSIAIVILGIAVCCNTHSK